MTYELSDQQTDGVAVTHIPPESANRATAVEPETQVDSSLDVYGHVTSLLYDFSDLQRQLNQAPDHP